MNGLNHMKGMTKPVNLCRVVERINNFLLPTSSRNECIPFYVDYKQVGIVQPDVALLLQEHPEIFTVSSTAIHLNNKYGSCEERTEIMKVFLNGLREAGHLNRALKGWRNETYNIRHSMSEPVLFRMERSAAGPFGVTTYGCHINGYTYKNGEMMMWVAKRSPTKQTYPNLLDQFVAGGLSSGLGFRECAEKECQEEASVPEKYLKNLKSTGTVSYVHEDERGVHPEVEFIYDLKLPEDFEPINADGEVQEFKLYPVTQLQEMIVLDSFKPNSAAIVLDFLIRHNIINPDNEPSYCFLVEMLHYPVQTLFNTLPTEA
ncbi:uncharacterized protein LOC128160390 [Crassostrea angulata]|uniref:Nudix hydrolase domain-containing protein n=1 Tax=Magallana gigas TaxID=29159 RepID=A0A8W8M0J1_MAGGI|nr:nudix hydrolase 20, chloroplastic [Crassostrea gigas]XP_052679663.1 uncharacterized protein LOC128160390 [Crassostrea angulata]